MNLYWKNRLRNYPLWVAVAALVLLLLKTFGIEINEGQYEELVNAILGVLVLAGIVNNPVTSDRGLNDDSDA